MKRQPTIRHAGKSLLSLLLCLLLAASVLLSAFAADTAKTLKASAVTQSSITLHWTAVKGATGYQLQQYKEKHWTLVKSTAKTETKVKNLAAAASYAFRVRAVKGKEPGAFSAVLRVRTAPAQVQNLTAKSVKATQVKLQWNKVRGAEGYRVRDLPADTAVRFRVAAFLNNGKQTVYGKNSAVCRVKTADLPGASQPHLYKKYHRMVENGTFLMVFTTDDSDLGDKPVTVAMKNGSVVVDTMLQGIRVRMIYDAKKNQNFMLVPAFRCYTELTEEMLADMDMQRSIIEFAEPLDSATAKVFTAEQDGETYTVEAFFEDGTQTNYYFKGETLVKIVTVEPDGAISSVFVQTMTDKVSDSLFEIPKGYRRLNLSFLF